MKAAKDRYADEEKVEGVVFENQRSAVNVQMVGMEKLKAFLTEFKNLKRLSVCNAKVAVVADNDEEMEQIKVAFTNVTELDLSCVLLICFLFEFIVNLFTKWDQILSLIQYMPLTSLVVNNNVLQPHPWNSFTPYFEKLQSISLHHVNDAWKTIVEMGKVGCWKKLTNLSLAHNQFTTFEETPEEILQILPNLSTLDLSSNKIEKLEVVSCFKLLPLTSLALNNNPLKTLFVKRM